MDILILKTKMRKKEQILFIHQNFPGQFRSLAPALIKEGYEVHALGEETNIKQVDDYPNLKLHYYKLTRGSTNGIEDLAVEFEAKMLRAKFVAEKCEELKNQGLKPSLIIAHPQWGESFFLKDVWSDTKILSYFELHWLINDSDIDFDDEFYDEKYYKFTVRKIRARNVFNYEIFNHSDKLISPTEFQRNTAPDYIKKNIAVIHDGIDTDLIKPKAAIEVTINDNLKLSKKDKIITFINRNLEPQRGYHIFMRSLPEIVKNNPDAHILIIGGQEKGYGLPPPSNKTWKNIFYEEVKDKLDTSKVHFLGIVDYRILISLFQISSLHIYLTYPFVLSWSLLEAMACECLILGSNTAPVKEVIKNNSNGILVDFFDQKKISKIVTDVLKNPNKYKKLRKEARNSVIKNYDLKTICLPKQINLIEKLLAE